MTGNTVPGDPKQNMYVWFEALMNYITTLDIQTARTLRPFGCNVHVIGKDINWVPLGYLAAMLHGLGLETPEVIYVHGMVLNDGQIMSKSLGNGVAPSEIVSGYGADAMRYYFTRHIPSNEDGDFTG